MEERAGRKVREGTVVSTKMQKIAVVAIERLVKHARYKKVLRRTRRVAVHDPEAICADGDFVRIMETRPLSKRKRWRVIEVIRKAVRV